MSVILGIMLAAALVGQKQSSEPVPTEDDKAAAAERLDFMKRSATVYKITLGEKETDLKLVHEPVLRWTNPVSTVPDGVLFLWVGPEGRPELAAQVFIAARTTDLWLHEFQSLSMESLTVARDSKVTWHPQKPGIEMKPVEDAPAPAESAVQRLSQMRTIAQSLQAADDFEGKSRWELRLLVKPLHRYGKPNTDILDGALFTYAHGTDPEVFLMLEARGSPGKYRWHYALAPMTAYAVKVSAKGKELWNTPHRQAPFPQDEPYFILKYVP
jgi:hypothetical protein